MKQLLPIFLTLITTLSFAQTTSKKGKDIRISPYVDGTIAVPSGDPFPALAIIIGDSGPTDRNGNQQMQRTNTLRFLAEGLYDQNIASFRYDKRIVKQMKDRTLNEESIRFDDFITDAITTIDYFKKANAFSKIYVIGHGQGSLVGMIAAQGRADGFISLDGVGQEIDDVIVDQLAQQAPGLKDNARQGFDDMRAHGEAVNFSPGVASFFRKELQPFMLTWMRFNPQEEIAKLEVPVFIVMGDKDLQVLVSESEKLHTAKKDASYLLLKDMNHILKKIEGNSMENSKSYNEPNRPVMPELIEAVSSFILKE